MSYRSFKPSGGRSHSRSSGYRGHSRYGSNNRRSNGSRGKYIDPKRFVCAAQPVEEKVTYVPKHQFSDFQINNRIKSNLRSKGYQTPSPIQDQAIPEALAGRDVIGIANTGTGKTAAFCVPMLQKLLSDRNSKALIIAPTRELAIQIDSECRSISQGSGLIGAVLIGGAPIGSQFRSLRRNPRIVVGTPGRIEDHIKRRSLNLSGFNFVVLDEVDRMLDMGFIQPMQNILSQTSPNRQSLFFSATMDHKVETLINEFSNEPVSIALSTRDASHNVDQNVINFISEQDKIAKLRELLNSETVTKAIIFNETQRDVRKLHINLLESGFSAESIHGGKNQSQRQRALRKFKSNDVNILVATDVAARGIDVVDITHVINYTIPQTYEDYTHRVGRAGRAGRIGHALTFVSQTSY